MILFRCFWPAFFHLHKVLKTSTFYQKIITSKSHSNKKERTIWRRFLHLLWPLISQAKSVQSFIIAQIPVVLLIYKIDSMFMDSQIFNNVSLAISITGARNRGGHQSSLMKIISTVGSSRREPLRLVMAVAFIRKLALTLSMDTVLRFYRLVQYSSSGRISELYMPISFRISHWWRLAPSGGPYCVHWRGW